MPKSKAKNPYAPVVAKDGSVTLYVRVTHCNPDMVQYKPYSTSFEPLSPVIVPVTVQAQHVIGVDSETVILTPAGWFMVAKALATGAMLAHAKV